MKKLLIILTILLLPAVASAQLNVRQGGTGTTTMPTSRIPFGLNALRIGTSDNLFWDNTNSRLGISTTTPDSKLIVVYSSAGGEALFRAGYSNAGIYYGAYAQGGDGGAGSASLGVFDDNTSSFYGLYSDDSDAFNYLAGTTTIGTLIPAAKLTVVDGGIVAGSFSADSYQVELADVADQRALHATDGAGNTGSLGDASTGAGVSGTGITYGVLAQNSSASGYGLLSLQNHASGYSIFAGGGKNYFGGNVGVSSTSPWALLSINPNNTGSAPAFAVGSTTKTSFIVNNAGLVGISTTSPTAALTFNAGTTAVGGIDFGNDVQLYRSAANVLTLPDAFVVTGTIYSTGGISNTSTSNNAYLTLTASGGVMTRNIADASPAFTVLQQNAGSTGDILRLQNGAGTASVFTQSGALGVGTSTPATLVDVFASATSTLRIDSNHASRGSCLVMKDFDGSGYTFVVANNGTLTASTIDCR